MKFKQVIVDNVATVYSIYALRTALKKGRNKMLFLYS